MRVSEVLAQFREVEARELRQGAEAVCGEEGVVAVGAFCVGGEGKGAEGGLVAEGEVEGLGFAGRVEGGGGVGAIDLEFVEGQMRGEGGG